jgi:hypothetical protein
MTSLSDAWASPQTFPTTYQNLPVRKRAGASCSEVLRIVNSEIMPDGDKKTDMLLKELDSLSQETCSK